MASFFWYVLFFYDINYCNMHTYIFFPALPLLPGSKSSDPIRILERIWIKISRGGFRHFWSRSTRVILTLSGGKCGTCFFQYFEFIFPRSARSSPLAGNVWTAFSFFSNSLLYIHIYIFPSSGEGELSRNWCEFHRVYSITSL